MWGSFYIWYANRSTLHFPCSPWMWEPMFNQFNGCFPHSNAGQTNLTVTNNAFLFHSSIPLPIGSMYGIYADIWGILMVNVTIYSIHGSYGFFAEHGWISDVAHPWRLQVTLAILASWRRIASSSLMAAPVSWQNLLKVDFLVFDDPKKKQVVWTWSRFNC